MSYGFSKTKLSKSQKKFIFIGATILIIIKIIRIVLDL